MLIASRHVQFSPTPGSPAGLVLLFVTVRSGAGAVPVHCTSKVYGWASELLLMLTVAVLTPALDGLHRTLKVSESSEAMGSVVGWTVTLKSPEGFEENVT